MSSIVKRLNGRFLLVEIDKKEDESSQDNLTTTKSGIIIEKKDEGSGVLPFVLATVVSVGDELTERYKQGNRVMLVTQYRGEPIPYNDFKGVRIPEGSVIAVL